MKKAMIRINKTNISALKDQNKEQMQKRIELLSSEIDGNLDENRAMESEINVLYTQIDALK